MITVLISALLIGIACGVSPGPMLVLVVTASLRHGLKAGLRMALAPLISDLPVLATVFGVFWGVAPSSRWLGLLACAGATYLGVLAVKEFRRARPTDLNDGAGRDGVSVREAVVVNFLNPHPWLFWFGVGGPMVLTRSSDRVAIAGLFVVAFYVGLVGVKVVLAWGVSRLRGGLNAQIYGRILQGAAVALMLCAAALLIEGLRLSGTGS